MRLLFYFILFLTYSGSSFVIYYFLKRQKRQLAIVFVGISFLIGLALYMKKRSIYNKLKSILIEIKIPSSNKNCETTIYSLNVHKDDYTKYHRPYAIKTRNNGFIKDQATLKKFIQRRKIVEIEEKYIQDKALKEKIPSLFQAWVSN